MGQEHPLPLRKRTCGAALTFALLLAACSSGGSSSAGTGGAGGTGPCPTGETVVQQLISTETTCSLTEPATQCATVCDLACAKDFDLGSKGSGCAMEDENTAYCRCVCAYCRTR